MERKTIHLNGILDDWGYQRSNIQYLLNKHKDSPVLVIVNSFGGSVNEGLAISKLFEEHGDVVVRFIGCCASAATWLAYGAKSVEIADDGLLLVHQCSNLISIYRSMKIDEIDKTIKQLESTKKSQEAFNLTIAKKYADRCSKKGKNFEDVLRLMEEERWMTASEAYDWGLVDAVIPGSSKMSKDEIDSIVHNCAAMNLPTPQFQSQPSDDATLVNKVVNALKGLLKSDDSAKDAKPDTDNNLIQQPQKTTEMKEYVSINALLGVTLTAGDNGNVSLTAEQLQSIENALLQSKNHEQTVNEIVTELDKISDNVKAISGAKNKVLAVTALLNSIPAGAPAGNLIPSVSDDKSKKIDESAKDDINKEARDMYAHQYNK